MSGSPNWSRSQNEILARHINHRPRVGDRSPGFPPCPLAAIASATEALTFNLSPQSCPQYSALLFSPFPFHLPLLAAIALATEASPTQQLPHSTTQLIPPPKKPLPTPGRRCKLSASFRIL